jgi:hypothetical protein
MFLFIVSYSYSQNGIIRELTGDVEIKLAGSSTFVPAVAGTEVSLDSIISTGFRSTAIIAIGSSVITVRPLTRLSLAEIQSSASSESLNINLQTGRLKVDVKPPAGTRVDCVVQSPSATASVRGTSFEMDTQTITVIEGSVAFSSSTGFGSGVTTMVKAGDTSTVTSEGSATNPASSSVEDVLPPAPIGSGISGDTTPAGKPTLTTGDLDMDFSW